MPGSSSTTADQSLSTLSNSNPGRNPSVREMAPLHRQRPQLHNQTTSTSHPPLSTSSSASLASASSLRPSDTVESHRMQLMHTSPRQSQHQYHSSSNNASSRHPAGWDRPYSSGQPAPATAVPIFRTPIWGGAGLSRSANNFPSTHLPDSPPDTPPHSPPLTPIRFPAGSSRRNDEVVDDEDDASSLALTDNTGATQSTLDLLTEATQTLILQQQNQQQKEQCQNKSQEERLTTRESKPDQRCLEHAQEHRSHPASASASASAITIGGGLMPATPEISPDNDVRHHAQKSARAFLQRIFEDVPSYVAVEDAGVELVSPSWSGAVIKSGTGDNDANLSSTADSTNTDSSASSDRKRTLYVSMPDVVDPSLLREQVLAVLDAASDKLGCETVMICLQRQMKEFASVLHGLCYVGGQIVAAGRPSSSSGQAGGGSGTDPLADGSSLRLTTTDPVSNLCLKHDLVLVAIEL